MDRERTPALLKAGNLEAVFEPETGFLRTVSFKGFEICRAVYGAVRDRNWATVPGVVTVLERSETPSRSSLRFAVRCEQDDLRFSWTGRIDAVSGSDPDTGRELAELSFSFDGVAESSFVKTRIGLCAVHPVEGFQGEPCTVIHPDGKVSESGFPVFIAPDQPFRDIAGMNMTLPDGSDLELRFSGEVFETEDQRNWTDASYKTYCPPLVFPFQVPVRRGDRVSQEVQLRVRSAADGIPRRTKRPAHTDPENGPRGSRLPRIGFSYGEGGLTDAARTLIRELAGPAHVRCELDLSRSGWESRLREVRREAESLRCPVECVLFVSDREPEFRRQIREAVIRCAEESLPVARFMPFSRVTKLTEPGMAETAAETINRLRAERRDCLRDAGVCIGTDLFFAELNRTRPGTDGAGGVTFSVNPQVHAEDDLTVIENIRGQRYAYASLERLYPSVKRYVSPLTLKPRYRFSPSAHDVHLERPPADPRQKTRFGAVFTLGSVAMMCGCGITAATLYELFGDRGLLGSDGGVYPLFHVLADLAESSEWDVYPLSSAGDTGAVGLLLRSGPRVRLLIGSWSVSAVRLQPRTPSTASDTAASVQSGGALFPESAPRAELERDSDVVCSVAYPGPPLEGLGFARTLSAETERDAAYKPGEFRAAAREEVRFVEGRAVITPGPCGYVRIDTVSGRQE